MPLVQVHHFSNAIQKCTGLTLVVPDGAGPFPVVYQLHGLSDDHTIWQRRTSIERYADRYGFIIAMPDGGRGFYCDHPGTTHQGERHLLETVALVDRMFRTITDRRGRAIGGLSMGGYGSMKLGIKRPDLFGSVVSHSSAFAVKRRVREYPDLAVFHAKGLPAGDDPFALASKLAKSSGPKPRIRFDCGVDDFLLDDNRRFRAHLLKLGVEHQYAEFPGAHSWDYWDEHIDEALRFHRESFALMAKKKR
jgi:S-formylglutathione hydrolase FrmB